MNAVKRWVESKVRAIVGTEAIVRTVSQRSQAESERIESVVRERARVLEDVTIGRLDHVRGGMTADVRTDVRDLLSELDGRLAAIEGAIAGQRAHQDARTADAARGLADALRNVAKDLGARIDANAERIDRLAEDSATRAAEPRVPGVSAHAFDRFAADLLERELDHVRTAERERQDLMILLDRLSPVAGAPTYDVSTEHPVALHSDDHRHPLGAAKDYTRSPRFVRACERVFAGVGRPLRSLDIGCAGGGVVLDFCLRGHEGVGLEGSDHALVTQRAAWRLLADRLFTADATERYTVLREGTDASFDVISAWEVLEHIPEDRLEGFFTNVRRHLTPDGVFCASVATFECADPETGAVYHVTVKPREWWVERVRSFGFEPAQGLFATGDFARGSGNGPASFDWDADARPEMGFHLVLRARG